jgi:hypothetical protein
MLSLQINLSNRKTAPPNASSALIREFLTKQNAYLGGHELLAYRMEACCSCTHEIERLVLLLDMHVLITYLQVYVFLGPGYIDKPQAIGRFCGFWIFLTNFQRNRRGFITWPAVIPD